MTGICGGTTDSETLGEMADSMHREDWYELEQFVEEPHGLGISHHGRRDPAGHTTWQRNDRAGVLYGAVSNLNEDFEDTGELFDAVIDRPVETLSRLDGPFVVAGFAASSERMVVATDKIGARPCFYSTDGGLWFSSELKALVPVLDRVEIDLQGVSDLLLLGNLWGEKTLLDGVRALAPATVLVADGGDVTTTRYWDLSFERRAPTEEYVFDLVRTYRAAIDAISGTVTGSGSVSLSGGLDSRSLASELARGFDANSKLTELLAYTYDSNPPGAGNPALAREIAAELDIAIEEVPVSPDSFLEVVETAITTTDGMVRWDVLINASSVFGLDRVPDVVVEGAGQGELLGEHMWQAHVTNADSPADSMYRSEASVSEELVRSILVPDIDPLQSFRDVARRSDASTDYGTVLAAHYDNHYSRYLYASNQMIRARTGTRVPYAHGEFLGHVADLPFEWRLGSLPLTGGRIPYPTSWPKYRLIRALSADLAAIPYERTRLAPLRPYWAHALGFVATTGLARLRGNATYGGPSLADQWYRRHDGLREFVDKLLSDACERPFFDEATIRALRNEHLSGNANNVTTLAPITTIEFWLQQYVDPVRAQRNGS